MHPASPGRPDSELQRELALMRRRSRELSRQKALAWVALLVVPAIVGAATLALTISETRALVAAILANWLVRKLLKRWRWKEP
jgi:hypothetical protein